MLSETGILALMLSKTGILAWMLSESGSLCSQLDFVVRPRLNGFGIHGFKYIYRYDHPLGDREVRVGEKGSRLTAVWDLDLFCVGACLLGRT